MIRSFRSKALKRFFEKSDARGLPPQSVRRIGLILDLLDQAAKLEQLNVPGLGLHQLKGKRRGDWAVTVTRNWRITFRFIEETENDAESLMGNVFTDMENEVEALGAEILELEYVESEAEFSNEPGAHDVNYEDYH